MTSEIHAVSSEATSSEATLGEAATSRGESEMNEIETIRDEFESTSADDESPLERVGERSSSLIQTCASGCCVLTRTEYDHRNDESIRYDVLSKAGVFVYDPLTDRVLIVLSRDKRWGCPKGTLQEGETPSECAAREVWEETGLRLDAAKLTEAFTVHNWYSGARRRPFRDEIQSPSRLNANPPEILGRDPGPDLGRLQTNESSKPEIASGDVRNLDRMPQRLVPVGTATPQGLDGRLEGQRPDGRPEGPEIRRGSRGWRTEFIRPSFRDFSRGRSPDRGVFRRDPFAKPSRSGFSGKTESSRIRPFESRVEFRKRPGRVEYYFSEHPVCEIRVPKTVMGNDVNGHAWVRLECLLKLTKKDPIKITNDFKILLRRFFPNRDGTRSSE